MNQQLSKAHYNSPQKILINFEEIHLGENGPQLHPLTQRKTAKTVI